MRKQRSLDVDRMSDADLAAVLSSFDAGEEASRDCPSPESVWAAADGDLAAEDLARIADHAAGCPGCFHDLRAARQAAEELRPGFWIRMTKQPVETSRDWLTAVAGWLGIRAGGGGLAPAWRPAAAASVVTAAVCTALFLVLPPSTGPWPVPGPARAVAVPGPAVQLEVHDGQTLARDRCVLTWLGIEGARYDVRVMTVELDPVAVATDLAEPKLHVDEQNLAQLEAGTVLVWQVDAYLPDGRRIRSRASRVRLD